LKLFAPKEKTLTIDFNKKDLVISTFLFMDRVGLSPVNTTWNNVLVRCMNDKEFLVKFMNKIYDTAEQENETIPKMNM
jgi:hypothetical protein